MILKKIFLLSIAFLNKCHSFYLTSNQYQYIIFLINWLFRKSKLYHYLSSKNDFYFKKIHRFSRIKYLCILEA
jgi:hypothetical protein